MNNNPIFTEFYPHGGCYYYKIKNPWTQFAEEKIALCPVESGIDEARSLALAALTRCAQEALSVPLDGEDPKPVEPVKAEVPTGPNTLQAIGERLRTQDNRITENPMFCVQILRRDVGYDAAYGSGRCWYNAEQDETVYDDDEDFVEPVGDQWERFGYKDRWETTMVAFTEAGCEEYIRLNGHNDRRRAHKGQIRVYVESFNRCPEMIEIRKSLMEPAPKTLSLLTSALDEGQEVKMFKLMGEGRGYCVSIYGDCCCNSRSKETLAEAVQECSDKYEKWREDVD